MTNSIQSAPSPAAALVTPRGRGAVATIRFVGDCRTIDDVRPALFQAANGKPLCEQRVGRVVFGRWGAVAEEVVVCRIDEREVEIHCHGGEAAADRIVGDLQAAGCDILSWQQLSKRTAGCFETECLETLSRATTQRTAEILLQQHTGLLRSTFESLRLSDWNPQTCREALQRIEELLCWAEFGLHLSRPWSVVLAGRPNVGKSSLINALVGYARSIVYDQPGTTRDVVTAETALDGWPVELADTAGIRAAAEDLESAGIALARRRMAAADCRLLLLDVSRPPHEEDRELLREWPDALPVAHKSDLPDVWGEELPSGARRVSSVTGVGVDDLAAELVKRLVPEVPPRGTPVPITHRQIDLLNTACTALQQQDETGYCEAIRALL